MACMHGSPIGEHCPVCAKNSTAGPKVVPLARPKEPNLPTGWICPRCNTVNAPHIATCGCTQRTA